MSDAIRERFEKLIKEGNAFTSDEDEFIEETDNDAHAFLARAVSLIEQVAPESVLRQRAAQLFLREKDEREISLNRIRAIRFSEILGILKATFERWYLMQLERAPTTQKANTSELLTRPHPDANPTKKED